MWIFHGCPDEFDIDGYLSAIEAGRVTHFSWQVRQERLAPLLAQNQPVLLWRSTGRSWRERGEAAEPVAGVVAKAIVNGEAYRGPVHPEAGPFWRRQAGGSERLRVPLSLTGVAHGDVEVLRREWVLQSRLAGDLAELLEAAQPTNYHVGPETWTELDRRWRRMAEPWDERDYVACLWAYLGCKDGPPSSARGSRPSLASGITRRPRRHVHDLVYGIIPSVDPLSRHHGRVRAPDLLRRVWREYFDERASALDARRIEAAVEAAWGTPGGWPDW